VSEANNLIGSTDSHKEFIGDLPAREMDCICTNSGRQAVSFSADDGGAVCGDLYGRGGHAVVLAHGGRFKKDSWRVQANALISEGFRVLAIDFRGFGRSPGPGQADFDHAPFENDVLAAVRYLKVHGAKAVSVLGASFGGAAAGDASIKSARGEIHRIVFLGAAPNLSAEKLQSRALFIVARDDREWRRTTASGHPCSVRKGSRTESIECFGRLRSRSVSFSN
jgi:pimeloyl-ACP methyl ester carboxylesterase